MTTCVL